MTRPTDRSPRRFLAVAPLACALLVCAALTGCQQKMAAQPSYKPDDACAFFPDGKSARPLVAGTVARGHLRTDTALFTGRQPVDNSADTSDKPAADKPAADKPETDKPARNENSAEPANRPLLAAEAAQFDGVVDEFPFAITADVMEHGRNRYMIYCVVCHDSQGTGLGKIVERGYTRPPSYHIERLRRAPVGHFFRVITRGYGSMPSYAAQIPTRDRWAITAYIRALQLSQRFPEEKLPEDMRKERAAAEIAAASSAGGSRP